MNDLHELRATAAKLLTANGTPDRALGAFLKALADKELLRALAADFLARVAAEQARTPAPGRIKVKAHNVREHRRRTTSKRRPPLRRAPQPQWRSHSIRNSTDVRCGNMPSASCPRCSGN